MSSSALVIRLFSVSFLTAIRIRKKIIPVVSVYPSAGIRLGVIYAAPKLYLPVRVIAF